MHDIQNVHKKNNTEKILRPLTGQLRLCLSVSAKLKNFILNSS